MFSFCFGRGAAGAGRRYRRVATVAARRALSFFCFLIFRRFAECPASGLNMFCCRSYEAKSQVRAQSRKEDYFFKKLAREVHPGARSALRRGYRANTVTQTTKPNQKSEPRAEKKIILKNGRAKRALARGARSAEATEPTQ